MTKDELDQLVDSALRGDTFNTNEKADEIREAIRAAYESSNYPGLAGLEYTWRKLEREYEVIDRLKHSSDNPLVSFEYLVESGFYPPPEILLAIRLCIRRYLDAKGDISLDESFFGLPHKKRSSYAYNKAKPWKHFDFYFFWVYRDEFIGHNLKGLSLEKRAELYLENTRYSDTNAGSDVDSFLRSYRRWLESYSPPPRKDK